MPTFRLIATKYVYGNYYFERHWRDGAESWGVYDYTTFAYLAEKRTTTEAMAFVDTYDRARKRAAARLSKQDRQLLGIK